MLRVTSPLPFFFRTTSPSQATPTILWKKLKSNYDDIWNENNPKCYFFLVWRRSLRLYLSYKEVDGNLPAVLGNKDNLTYPLMLDNNDNAFFFSDCVLLKKEQINKNKQINAQKFSGGQICNMRVKFLLGGGFSYKKIHKTYCDKNTNIDMNQTDQYENFN